MLIATMLGALALWSTGPQDEIVQTGPRVTATERQDCVFGGQPVACPTSPAPPVADPTPTAPTRTPVCSFGGRPVISPGCPMPETRQTEVPETDDPWAAVAPGAFENTTQAAGDATPVRSRLVLPEMPPAAERPVPAWAFADAPAWEASECRRERGADGCDRRARNRLAMARAGAAEPVSTPRGPREAPAPRCRRETVTSQDGTSTSTQWVCGDGAASAAALGFLRDQSQPVTPPPSCQRPMEGEDTPAWMARCDTIGR